jgi:hypothetical protein
VSSGFPANCETDEIIEGVILGARLRVRDAAFGGK